MNHPAPHISVLQAEVLEAFRGVSIPIFFDGTVGAGGHAAAILSEHPEIERYLACDRDATAHAQASARLAEWGKKVELIRGSYSELPRYLRERRLSHIHGFLIDVGISSMQIDTPQRGFSFRFDGPLDMRMDETASLTAEELVNRLSERELERIFHEYGEEPRARQAAQAVVHARRRRPLRTTTDLCKALEPALRRRGKLHPATLIFQALRIAVNDELGELARGLDAAIDALAPAGRLAVIAFHSLEDRIVKQKLKTEARLSVLTKKPIVPGREEQRANPRARSAKLRVAEKRGEPCES